MAIDPNDYDPSDDPTFTVVGNAIHASFFAVDGSTASPVFSASGNVVTVSAGGLTLNLNFDTAAMAASASLRAGIAQAAGILASLITDKITVNLNVDISGSGGGAAAGPDSGLYESYSLIRSDLVNNASAGDATFNALPSGSSIQGQTNVAVWNAQLKLWGLLNPNDATTDDGGATFAADINPNLIVGVALHELTHAMGRIPYGTAPDVFDLFRFTGVGTRLFQGGATAPAAYFSLDGGNTKIADYGQTSDASDFLNSGVQGRNDPFNEFYSGSTSQVLTAVDLQQLDALGFHLHTNHPPVVTVPQTVISAHAGQTFAASSLFSASDADGDTLTYVLYDDSPSASSGHFVVNGTIVPAQTEYAVTAAQLAQTTFVAGSGGTSDDLYVKAFDGQSYSGGGTYSYFHINTAADHAPVVTISQAMISATAGQTFTASSLFSATDADGDALTYYLYDDSASASSGHFVVNGTIVPAQTAYAVTAAQLAQTTFVAGTGGTSDDLYVKAYDGQLYSNNGYFSYFHVNTAASSDHAPAVTIPQTVISATPGQSLAATSLFSASDADGDTLTYYLYDDNAAASSGHFVVNGTVVPAQTAYAVTAAQLAQTTFVAGSGGTSDDLYVKAYDGQLYSNNGYFSYFHVNSTAATGINHAPVVTVPQTVISATSGQTFTASSLFSASDADGDTLTYYLYDDSPSASSGHFAVNGTVVPAQTEYVVTAAQLAQTTFVAGSGGSSDDLYVKAYDGQAYSGNGYYSYFHVNTTGSGTAPLASQHTVFASGDHDVSNDLATSVGQGFHLLV
ncbi:NF038122 family metalloprotease [Bradyrhizobium manausense]|uniref:NF038122 family metalloprotease n=1 Tax=Bradyrhizobium manausense TaxID=989370 RepID=UPI0020139F6C|nr:NF038122 family metalloprotease [Bradyrhizobium manausense]